MVTLSTCLPLRVLARQSSSANDEAPALAAGHQEFAPAHRREHRHQIGLLLDVDEEPNRLAMAASARKLARLDGVEAPVGGEDRHFDVVSAGNAKRRPSSALKATPDEVGDRRP